MTYSILAVDPESGQIGAAVQSHFFASGRAVPWVRPGVGAVATQAIAEPTYGPRGLDLLERGIAPADVVEKLLANDVGSRGRQVAVIAADGRTSSRTGSACLAFAGQLSVAGLSVQGNMLVGPEVLRAMFDTYVSHPGSFPERLVAALDAAEAAGGDLRGRQSAALLVSEPTQLGTGSRGVDLRVDDHTEPLVELRRLLALDTWYSTFVGLLEVPGLFSGSPNIGVAAVPEALSHLSTSSALQPSNPEPEFWRCILLTRIGREQEASTLLGSLAIHHHNYVALYERVAAAGEYFAPTVGRRVLDAVAI